MKSALWPGGKWFASLGPYAAAKDAQSTGKRPEGKMADSDSTFCFLVGRKFGLLFLF